MRSASPWWGNVDDDAPTLPDHPRELVLRLGETTRRDRRSLRLEDVRLRARERIKACRLAEVGRLEPFLLPHSHDVVESPDEIGGPAEERREPADPVLEQVLVGYSLGRRIDRRLVDRMQRALRERRERTHVLDLVAEELDRSGSRPVLGNTSTSPPRTAIWPRSSTRSTRS